MKPTAQRAQWGEGVSPRQAFAARVEEQREQTRERLRNAENVRRRQLGMAPVETPAPETKQEPVEARFERRVLGTPAMGDYIIGRDIDWGALAQLMSDRINTNIYGAFGLDPTLIGGRRETPEERRRKEVERKAADERAKGLLREAGPEGALLASGEAAIIPSQHCPDITYALVPEGNGMVHIFRERLGHMGHICIQAKNPTPPADVLLTRLMLCKHHEEELWRTGNFFAGFQSANLFLPKMVRDWMPKRRANQWEFMPMGLMNWGR